MAMIDPKAQRWLKTAHISFACVWGGAALCLVLLHVLFTPHSGDELFARDMCMKYIDDFIVASGALGCLATGFIFSMWTPWGFFKHKWIMVKWAANLGFIAFGAVYFVPWLNHMVSISNAKRLAALEDPGYLHSRFMNLTCAVLMVVCLALIVWVSVFKPWMAKDK